MSDSLLNDVRLIARGWRWSHPSPATSDDALPDTEWARSVPARVVREAALGGALGPLLRSSLDVRVAGTEQLQRVAPPVVFVANHASHLDGLLILNALPATWRRRTVVAAAADYFFDTWWRTGLSALALNAVPLERRSGDGDQLELGNLLARGWNILAFPEGTRSRDGTLQRFHHGASRLALDARRPIVPVGLRGTSRAMPVGARWPRHSQVRVRFGPALVPSDHERTRNLTARLRAALQRLLVEDETTWWRAIRSQADGAQRQPDPARWRRVWASTAPLPTDRRPPVWPR